MAEIITSEKLVGLENVFVAYRRGLVRGGRKSIAALRDVTFDLYRGESLGVIGRNGAGKTTLLKLLARIIGPNRGTIHFAPNITATMLSLQVGFVPYLSGRENAILSGMLLGLPKRTIVVLLDEICELFGYPEYFDEPINIYSAGMRARLGFAVAYHVNPDIILLDEVLGVGDGEFRLKSSQLMYEKIQSEKTVVLVSHSPELLTSVCSRVVWIEGGVVRMSGNPEEVVGAYTSTFKR